MNDIETEKLLIYLRTSINKIQQIFNEELKLYGVTSSYFIYLILLRRNEKGLTMTELSKTSYVDKSLTTRVIKELEEKEYIYRDTKNITSRKYNIRLTEKGRKLADSIQLIMEKNRNKILKKFTEKEQSKIFEVLNLIVSKLINENE